MLDEEDFEDFFIDLTGSSSNATIAGSQAMVSIEDDDDLPDVTIADITVNEADGVATFTVSLSAVSGRDVSVDYFTTDYGPTDGFATAGEDYVSSSGSVTISAGNTTALVSVSITDDSLDEYDEALSVSLSEATNATNAVILEPEAVATIVDNDAPPELSINDVTAGEAAGYAEFTVSLSAPSGKDVTVQYTTADDTATAPDDYSSDSMPVYFAACGCWNWSRWAAASATWSLPGREERMGISCF